MSRQIEETYPSKLGYPAGASAAPEPVGHTSGLAVALESRCLNLCDCNAQLEEILTRYTGEVRDNRKDQVKPSVNRDAPGLTILLAVNEGFALEVDRYQSLLGRLRQAL